MDSNCSTRLCYLPAESPIVWPIICITLAWQYLEDLLTALSTPSRIIIHKNLSKWLNSFRPHLCCPSYALTMSISRSGYTQNRASENHVLFMARGGTCIFPINNLLINVIPRISQWKLCVKPWSDSAKFRCLCNFFYRRPVRPTTSNRSSKVKSPMS